MPTNPTSTNTTSEHGWFKATRGPEPLELIQANPLAYVLAAIIAHRAKWRSGFSKHGLAPGEAFLGDFASYGMSERNYRTAKEQLEKWGFATFKVTNKGTIAKLTGTRLFSVLPSDDDGQADRQPTGTLSESNGDNFAKLQKATDRPTDSQNADEPLFSATSDGFNGPSDGQSDRQPTGSRQAADRQPTTNEEQNKGRTRERNTPSAEDFEAFWQAYPRKVGKGAALKAWNKATDLPSIDAILAAIEQQRQSEQWQRDGGRYIPHPETWLAETRWLDEGIAQPVRNDHSQGF